MIIGSKDIYEEVAIENNIDVELVNSIGSTVFQQLRTLLNDPEELAYELPKIGTFIMRFKRFEKYFNNFQNHLNNKSPEAIKKYENNIILYEKNKKLIEKMKKYREDKQLKRKLRYE